MKRVLLCVNSDIGRGNTIGFRFGIIAHMLKQQGVEVDIIARANYDTALTVRTPWYKNYLGRALNFLHIYITPFVSYRSIEVWIFDRFVLRQLKKKGTCDYQVAHIGESLSRSMAWLKQNHVLVFLDIPIAHDAYVSSLRERGIDANTEVVASHAYIDRAISEADVLVCPSAFVVNTVQQAGFTTPYIIIPFGADKVFVSEHEESHTSDAELVFLFAGSIALRKGARYLLEAWNGFSKRSNCRLVLCGRIYKEIQPYLKKTDMARVTLVGFTRDIQAQYRAADVFVLPSLMEGSAKAVYEAMAYGLPVITTENTGSIVENGKTGYIVPIADAAAITEKLEFLYTHRERLRDMSDAAKAAVAPYTWEAYARRVVASYTATTYDTKKISTTD